MSYDNNIENNNNGESQISSIPAANSLIYKFEHGERLKLEQEDKILWQDFSSWPIKCYSSTI